ncbi:unnamed protein product [Acanthosepion pharaonis]|uniref:Uncharacterized protein n=1 Tax=Acanthosepion pharaonis TaxID=158019 RepID=A0A812BIS2_ACAPH|nr:unnamed protein product [Sepia pharaonis]
MYYPILSSFSPSTCPLSDTGQLLLLLNLFLKKPLLPLFSSMLSFLNPPKKTPYSLSTTTHFFNYSFIFVSFFIYVLFFFFFLFFFHHFFESFPLFICPLKKKKKTFLFYPSLFVFIWLPSFIPIFYQLLLLVANFPPLSPALLVRTNLTNFISTHLFTTLPAPQYLFTLSYFPSCFFLFLVFLSVFSFLLSSFIFFLFFFLFVLCFSFSFFLFFLSLFFIHSSSFFSLSFTVLPFPFFLFTLLPFLHSLFLLVLVLLYFFFHFCLLPVPEYGDFRIYHFFFQKCQRDGWLCLCSLTVLPK